MASTFPGAIDSFTDPLANSSLASPSHSTLHSDINDAVEKVEQYMGLVKVIPTGATNGTVGATGTVTIGNAVTSVTVSGAFSSLYENYKVIISGGSCTTTGVLSLQLGATTSAYKWSLIYTTYGSTLTTLSSASASSINYAAIALPDGISGSFEVLSPQLAKNSYVLGNWAAASESGTMGGTIQNTTQYTAFTLLLSAGTMTGGSIRVYGYRN